MTSTEVPVEHVLIAHRERLCGQLDNMRKNNVMCDVTVICATTEFTAHKVVLSASSAFFHNKFTEDVSRLQVPEVEPEIMEMILSFVYTGHVLVVGDADVQLVLAAAHHLRVTHLYHWCREHMINGLTLQNLEHVWDVADLYSDPFLQSQVAQYAAKNFKKIVRNGTFIDLPAERLIALIGNDRLVASHHDDALAGVLTWVKHDPERRQRVLPDIIPHIKFDQLSSQYVNSLDGDPTVMASLELLQALTKTMARRYQRGSGLRRNLQKGGIGMFAARNPQPTSGLANVQEVAPVEHRQERSELTSERVDLRGGGGPDLGETIRRFANLQMAPIPKVGRAITEDYSGGASKAEPLLVVLGQDKEDSVVIHYFSLSSVQWGVPYRPAAQKKFASIVAHKDLIYMIGGKVNLVPSAAVHVVNVKGRRTQLVRGMSMPRCGMGVAELDGLIYVVGGYNKAGWLRDVECYDSVSDSWEMVASLHEGKEGVGVVATGGKLYAVGGVPVPTTEVYDPARDQWTKLVRMRHARVYHGIATLEGVLYVVGGFGHYPDRVQYFDHEHSTWNVMTSRAPQQCRDTWCTAIPWSNRILVMNSEGLLWDFDPNQETWTKLPSSFSLVGGYVSGFISATVLYTGTNHGKR